MLDRLERRVGRWAIPHLIVYLVAGQLGAYVLAQAKPEFAAMLLLIPARVMEGEVWRLVSFVFVPPSGWNGAFVLMSLYFYWSLGQTLEAQWGAFRFNAYLFLGWISATAVSFAVSFAVPGAIATNLYLMLSMLLAFAYLYPELQIRLFFLIPIRVKWIGWLTWAEFAFTIVFGDWGSRALAAAGVVSFFAFFGPDIWLRLRGLGRRRVARVQAVRSAATATHTCAECNVTDIDDPQMQFRYCSQCVGGRAYCSRHLRAHEHVRG